MDDLRASQPSDWLSLVSEDNRPVPHGLSGGSRSATSTDPDPARK